ncbi:unnamed protein product [Rhizoctonia solani]|uniref:Uncharacterized protein n=1 Tax=Rhizoctonia solani TaxID=456999 RepID=A0A8H3CVV0_9AGAM|nr:unnamed protein product [Rhizoctonia solani]
MASIQSAAGCCQRKTERREFGEIKPQCLCCQQSRIKCHEYTSSKTKHPNKLNTTIQPHSMSCTAVDESRDTAQHGTHLANTKERDLHLRDQLPLGDDRATCEAPYSAPSSTAVADVGIPAVIIDTNAPLTSNRSPSSTKIQNDVQTQEDEDLEGIVSIISRKLVLDRTAESNALPFVLQGYAAWIGRLAFDPMKMMGIARNFVFNHFGDGDQSRWIIGLLANIGTKVGSVELVEGQHNSMLSALQVAVRRRIGAVNSLHNPGTDVLVKALDCAVEAMLVHFYASPVDQAMTLRHEVAPIFRQLCPEPPGAPIDICALLNHPLGCLWHYAEMDIIFSVVSDTPTLFRYRVGIPGSQLSDSHRPVQVDQGDGIIQWLHGVPNQLILLFSRIKTMQHDKVTPNEGMITEFEQEIRGMKPFTGPSSEPFLGIMRSFVQECWRQTAYVYLYMAVCGDSSDTPRVKEAFKRFMRLINGTKPGRLPQRVLRLYSRDRTHVSTTFITFVIEDYWARADIEGRPVTWSDVSVSRKRVLGV